MGWNGGDRSGGEGGLPSLEIIPETEGDPKVSPGREGETEPTDGGDRWD